MKWMRTASPVTRELTERKDFSRAGLEERVALETSSLQRQQNSEIQGRPDTAANCLAARGTRLRYFHKPCAVR